MAGVGEGQGRLVKELKIENFLAEKMFNANPSLVWF